MDLKKIKNKGFTLIELLIVVAIIAILVTIAIPLFTSNLDKAKEATCTANRRTLLDVVVTDYITGGHSSYQDSFNAYYDTTRYTCPCNGSFSWLDSGEFGRVVCNVHNSAESSGGSVPAFGTVILSDSNGASHTIQASKPWPEIKASNSAISAGNVLSDSTGTWVIYIWSGINDPHLTSDMTVEDLVNQYPDAFLELNSGDKVLTSSDLIDLYSDKVWKVEPQKGSICYYDGKYYVAPYNIGKYTKPPGGWIEIDQP